MRLKQYTYIFLAIPVLSLCGCSGGSNVPVALSYPAAAPVYTRGVAIQPDTPASSGSVTSWSVSPALPAGLSLSPGTGTVSGTPTVVSATTAYTVSATSSHGSATTILSITVNDHAPSQFSYAAGTAVYIVNTPITPNSPSNAGGTVLSYSVSPALPAGLDLSTSTGIISGDPSAVTPASAYTVTATNSGGSAIPLSVSRSTLGPFPPVRLHPRALPISLATQSTP